MDKSPYFNCVRNVQFGANLLDCCHFHRINAYGCIATGHERGVIEVVTESDTIANIQQEMKANAFDKSAIYRWLKKMNPTEEWWVATGLHLLLVIWLFEIHSNLIIKQTVNLRENNYSENKLSSTRSKSQFLTSSSLDKYKSLLFKKEKGSTQ